MRTVFEMMHFHFFPRYNVITSYLLSVFSVQYPELCVSCLQLAKESSVCFLCGCL